MSKHILVIDLPDDNKCNGCPSVFYGAWHNFCTAINPERNVKPLDWKEMSDTIRPSDCPLIPVDRVMDRLYGLCQSQGDAGFRAVGILRDELGVGE